MKLHPKNVAWKLPKIWDALLNCYFQDIFKSIFFALNLTRSTIERFWGAVLNFLGDLTHPTQGGIHLLITQKISNFGPPPLFAKLITGCSQKESNDTRQARLKWKTWKQGKKRSAKQLRSEVLICFCLLALRRTDRVKWLPENNQLQRSVVNCAGPQ